MVRHLEATITSGRLAPGDLLPSERDLSAAVGVSRSVVREALGRLASLGLVTSVQGSGTRVAAPTTRPIEAGYRRLLQAGELDLTHLAELRLPLETAIAAQAARRRDDEHLARLVRAQQVLGNSRGTLDAHIQADLAFHAILAEAAGNPLFRIILAPIQELLIESRRRTLGKHGAALALEHHEMILNAVRAQDAVAAEAAMRFHLQANYQHLAEARKPS
jgi:GntR family transcriptional repressor for pyruvate dehydrogenase complex